MLNFLYILGKNHTKATVKYLNHREQRINWIQKNIKNQNKFPE